jgi:hypothetical protein
MQEPNWTPTKKLIIWSHDNIKRRDENMPTNCTLSYHPINIKFETKCEVTKAQVQVL